MTWSCNAKAERAARDPQGLEDNGLRLLLVGYESGSQAILNNVRKGIRLDGAREFTRHAKALGIKIHGTFIIGLPGETRETIRGDDRLRAGHRSRHGAGLAGRAVPGHGALPRGAASAAGCRTTTAGGRRAACRSSALGYPHLARTEIFAAVETFYRRFYFRPRKIIAIGGEMLRDRPVMRRRLGEGVDFLRFLARRRRAASSAHPLDSSSPTVAKA